MRVGVDIGGTFADLVAFDDATGKIYVGKALHSARGVVDSVREAFRASGLHLDLEDLDLFVHGTTMVTNLLIERTGAAVGLITSAGFRDVVELGRGYRPGTFDVTYQKMPPVVPRHLRREISSRIDARGHEAEPVDDAEVAAVVTELVARGADVIAVALHNSYANPAHERQVRHVCATTFPHLPVTVSTDVDNRIGEFERAATTCLNAMAVPRMHQYADELEAAVASTINYVHSAGGMLPSQEARERPVTLALSGPAAGVLAARQLGRWAGFRNVIALDVGGTSTDVCLIWDDEIQEDKEFDVQWGLPARTRAFAIHTIGAGGGSIASRDAGGALTVGPESAAADPGPACYGRGATAPTVTDANLLLGLLPAQAGLLGGTLPLDHDAATGALSALGETFGADAETIARGVFAIANANMAQAIRRITVERGIDPRDAILVAYGGAGPQHAVHVARELGIQRIAVPAEAGTFSALGLLLAEQETSVQTSVVLPLATATSSTAVREAFDRLTGEAHARLRTAAGAQVHDRRMAGLRYEGQSNEVPVEWLPESPDTMVKNFEEAHLRLYGTRLGRPLEVVDIWVSSRVEEDQHLVAGHLVAPDGDQGPTLPSHRYLTLTGDDVPVLPRHGVGVGRAGPCLVEETNSVTFVPSGFSVTDRGFFLLIEEVS